MNRDMFNLFKKKEPISKLRSFNTPPPLLPRLIHLMHLGNEVEKWSHLDKQQEAKHWQILSEYAADQVNKLSKVDALDLDTGATVSIDPDKENWVNVKTRTGQTKVVSKVNNR